MSYPIIKKADARSYLLAEQDGEPAALPEIGKNLDGESPDWDSIAQEVNAELLSLAEKHKNDDFTNTIFTDESSFQLFRNTVRRWTKNPNKELKCSPKNRQKVHIWGAISVKGVLTCHTFRCNLNGPYYACILEDYLLPAASRT